MNYYVNCCLMDQPQCGGDRKCVCAIIGVYCCAGLFLKSILSSSNKISTSKSKYIAGVPSKSIKKWRTLKNSIVEWEGKMALDMTFPREINCFVFFSVGFQCELQLFIKVYFIEQN